MEFKVEALAVLGAISSFIIGLFGGWDSALTTLVIFMSIDYVMGVIIAGFFWKSPKTTSGRLESSTGWKGLLKKGVTLLIVLVAVRLDMAVGTDFIKTAVVIAFIANETISIVENAGIMGVPIPAPIMNAIEMLQKKGDSK